MRVRGVHIHICAYSSRNSGFSNYLFRWRISLSYSRYVQMCWVCDGLPFVYIVRSERLVLYVSLKKTNDFMRIIELRWYFWVAAKNMHVDMYKQFRRYFDIRWMNKLLTYLYHRIPNHIRFLPCSQFLRCNFRDCNLFFTIISVIPFLFCNRMSQYEWWITVMVFQDYSG